MQEFDINEIWKAENASAQEYYNYIETDLLEKAKRKSSNILSKIKRNLIWETVVGIFLWAGIFFFCRHSAYLWLLAILGVFAFGVNGFYIYQTRKQIRNVSSSNVTESIGNYFTILKSNYRKVKIILEYLMPIGYFVGLVAGFTGGGGALSELFQWKKLIVLVPVSIIFILLYRQFIFKKYLPSFYGKHIKELKSVHEHLIDEIQEV